MSQTAASGFLTKVVPLIAVHVDATIAIRPSHGQALDVASFMRFCKANHDDSAGPAGRSRGSIFASPARGRGATSPRSDAAASLLQLKVREMDSILLDLECFAGQRRERVTVSCLSPAVAGPSNQCDRSCDECSVKASTNRTRYLTHRVDGQHASSEHKIKVQSTDMEHNLDICVLCLVQAQNPNVQCSIQSRTGYAYEYLLSNSN